MVYFPLFLSKIIIRIRKGVGYKMKAMEQLKEREGMDFLKQWWQELSKLWTRQTPEEIEDAKKKQKTKEFVILVNKAKEDWKDALNYFEEVTDPDLIELAIYRIEATRTFYIYLLKEAKRKGIRAEA